MVTSYQFMTSQLPNSSLIVGCEIMNLDPVNISSLPTGKMLRFVSREGWRDPGGGGFRFQVQGAPRGRLLPCAWLLQSQIPVRHAAPAMPAPVVHTAS